MISEKEVLEIHTILIERFGGTSGVRDKDLLDSALNRPYQTFDGNKRTGYILARLLMMNEQLDIHTEQEQKYQFVISISTGELSFVQIKKWLEKNSR